MPWSTVEIVSPHDSEARYRHKPGKVEWVGYKDHQTETCDPDTPNLVVHVATTPAPEQDISVVDSIHSALARRGLAPWNHLVDSGYVTPEAIHRGNSSCVQRSRSDPCRPPGGRATRLRQGRLPHRLAGRDGHMSTRDSQPPVETYDGRPQAPILRTVPAVGLPRLHSPASVHRQRRWQRPSPAADAQTPHEIQSQARAVQQTPEWKQRYALRAGAEATVSETVHAHGLRHCRYRGLSKTHVQHVLTAAGTNIIRISHHRLGAHRRPESRLQQLFRTLAP